MGIKRVLELWNNGTVEMELQIRKRSYFSVQATGKALIDLHDFLERASFKETGDSKNTDGVQRFTLTFFGWKKVIITNEIKSERYIGGFKTVQGFS